MSSNIRITRICQNCNKEFIAKTTVTQCCSDNCAKKLYKQKKKEEKVALSNKETSSTIVKPILEIHAKDFLSIKEASSLIGASRWTISSLIKQGKLKSGKFGKRVIIRRSDIDNYFNCI
ncbi:MAG: helix-turn-helix domain-containing protein [Sporocytophaga sp.]|uniref:helix-turn-helix domain-containing protein n=1 Tax=Sporocytophaga sp. TaxID=2231183 RepID=UPI001B288EF7|nr:helix-turn-helix domain-containing protein [Sporocytophaga sp.]MBO9703194.1 helix-turn-helix domain-containing protein [Sporocytophaga sp.]